MNYLTTHIPGTEAHEAVRVGTTAVGVGAFVNEGVEFVQVSVEGEVRATYDGVVPTGTSGYLYYDGHVFYEAATVVAAMQFVAVGAEAVLRVVEFVPNPLPAVATWKPINWLKFLHKVARRRQVDIESGAFSREWVGMVTEFVGSRLREVFMSAEWPPMMVVDERYYPDADDRYIPWREELREEIPEDGVDERRCVYNAAPKVADPACGLSCHRSVRGIEVDSEYADGSRVFVRYRASCPEFTTEVYDPERVYAYGDVVYDDVSGECFKSRMDENGHGLETVYWVKQLMPDLLADAVLYFVLGDLLDEDGQQSKAHRQWAYAEDYLMDLQERVFGMSDVRAVFVS